MRQRLDYGKLAPEPYNQLISIYGYLNKCGIEPSLLELIFLRVSQINGCAFCIDHHSQNARAVGETEQRLYCLQEWRVCQFYSDREKAALAWTEAVTNIRGGVPDELYDSVRQHFSDKEIVDINFAVVQMNALNRLAIPFKKEAGKQTVAVSDDS